MRLDEVIALTLCIIFKLNICISYKYKSIVGNSYVMSSKLFGQLVQYTKLECYLTDIGF